MTIDKNVTFYVALKIHVFLHPLVLLI
eukprot:SAG31_NODE_23243_length_508_cov_0.880196_2_plen_26_part_01